MANWRKQQGQNNHQGGQWRSYNRKPPLDYRHSTVPSWERKFCASIGCVSWRRLIKCRKYMSIHDNVLNWDDSSVKEAFDNAKWRFWAEINGFRCDISLPDPDMYIDNVDWDSGVDPELVLDLDSLPYQSYSSDESEAKEEERDKMVSLDESYLPPTGWGDEEEVPQPSDPNNAAQCFESNLPDDIDVNSWEQHCAPVENAKEFDWQNYGNDNKGWNQREHYYGGWHNNTKGRTRWNRNWLPWDGYDRKRENTSRSKNSSYHGNEYEINRRGRRNNRGRRRRNFAYDHPYVDKVPTASHGEKLL